MKDETQRRHYDSFLVDDDIIGEDKVLTAEIIIKWFEYLKKELGIPKMADENDIIQEQSPLEPYSIVLRHLWFENNISYYKEIKKWIRKNHPKVFVTEGQSSVWEIVDAVTIYFVTKELYMEFVNKWPKVLRGDGDES